MMTDFQDILYEERPSGVARITINRPASYNAFRGQTVEELIHAFQRAGWDRSIGVIVLTGAGDKAFCTGGDQGAHEGQYDGRGTIGLPIEELQSLIRDVPKPVIARVNGFAIGGGNVLATICDLTIASDKAQFGQVGPKVGSVDPGFGTAYLARVVGEKKAREIWYLCRRYTAQQGSRDGACQRRGPACRTRRRGRPLVRGTAREESDRDCAREALVRRRHRIHPRHLEHGNAGAHPVLRHRGIEGGRPGVPGKAQTRVPQVRPLSGRAPSGPRPATIDCCRLGDKPAAVRPWRDRP
jgi:dihydroxynaphthoic acid synthetase